MLKKSLIILLSLIFVVPLSGCLIPPFIDGGISASDYFYDKVKYVTFKIDAAVENGFIEADTGELSLENLTDGNEKNVQLRSYRSLIFTTKNEGVTLTDIAFIVGSDADCCIEFLLIYGKDEIAFKNVILKANGIITVYFSELNISLQKDAELKFLVLNPLNVGTVKFNVDSYIFMGQEV